MFLKSLTLKGFKSFAHTTTIEFAPGLSVVVGPNGSGKSNVVDAVAWVLGSQAPTMLRSQQMDEVIFAGNPGRAALGRAEVTLTLHNEDRRLPLDFDEVAVSRTLFRGGDSSYAINGATARLVDVSELLAAAGVGRHRHVIVSQGRIDAVLNAKPAERRAILEEAAGVSAYRSRKDKALRRLADTEANLARLADQLNEVRRALRPLERQAETARRHGALAAELASLQIHRLGVELSELRGRRREAAVKRRDLADRRAAATRELAGLDGRIGDAETRLSAVGHVQLAEATERLTVLRDRVLEARRAVEERRGDYERRRKDRLASDLLASLSDEAVRLEADIAQAQAAEAALSVERDRIAAATETLAVETEAHTARWESPDGPGDRSSVAQLRGRLMTLRDVAERAEAEARRLDGRSRLLEVRREEAAAAARRAEGEAAARGREEAAAGEALNMAAERRITAEEAEAEARRACSDAAAEHTRWRSRVDALALAMGDVRARSGMEVLAGSDGVLGALGDLVAVDDGWEAAFEAAAGEALAAAVVEGPEAARGALAALARAHVAGAVLLAHPPGGARPPVGAPLRPHVRGRRRGVDEVLDGLIGAAVVVASWSEACDVLAAHPDATVVTPAGDCFSRTGWRVGVARSGATGEALEESRDSLGRAESSLAAADRAAAETAAAAAAAAARHAEATTAHAE
ncbi:MAG: AAA family ATPase, partial [bacterium]|nr:AAA family ATPase [bacterium]